MASANDFGRLIDANQVPQPAPALPVADTIPTGVPIPLQHTFQDPFSDHLVRVNPTQQRLIVQAVAADNTTIASNNSTRRRTKAKAKAADTECSDAEKRRRILRKRLRKKLYARSSNFRGVIKRPAGGFEAFVWDNSDPTEKAKTVYIGIFGDERLAARAHDLIALKLWGTSTVLNFPANDYRMDIEDMNTMTKQEYLLSIRRVSAGFARGNSQYRGVSGKPTKANPNVIRWQARLASGKNYRALYLGTFDTERAAAQAYDLAAIRVRGADVVTNFPIRRYNVANILRSQELQLGRGTSRQFLRYSMDEILRRLRIDAADQNVVDGGIRLRELLQLLNRTGGGGAAAAVQNQNPALPKPEPVTLAAFLAMIGRGGSTSNLNQGLKPSKEPVTLAAFLAMIGRGGSTSNLNQGLKPSKVEPVGVNSGAAMNTAGIGYPHLGGSQVTSFPFPQDGGIQTPLFSRGFNSNNGAFQPPLKLPQRFAERPYHLGPPTLPIPGVAFSLNKHSPNGVAVVNQRIPNSGPFAANGAGWLGL